jgi:hypothetical protein
MRISLGQWTHRDNMSYGGAVRALNIHTIGLSSRVRIYMWRSRITKLGRPTIAGDENA